MSSNPMGPMPGDNGDPGEDNDSQDMAECEQKIASLEQRMSAVEQKVGIGSAPKAPTTGMPSKNPGAPKPFFGGSY